MVPQKCGPAFGKFRNYRFKTSRLILHYKDLVLHGLYFKGLLNRLIHIHLQCEEHKRKKLDWANKIFIGEFRVKNKVILYFYN